MNPNQWYGDSPNPQNQFRPRSISPNSRYRVNQLGSELLNVIQKGAIPRTGTSPAPKPSYTADHSLKRENVDQKEEMDRLRKENAELRERYRGNNQGYPNSSGSGGGNPSQRGRSQSPSNRTCFNCRSPHHLARDCNQPKQNFNPSNVCAVLPTMADQMNWNQQWLNDSQPFLDISCTTCHVDLFGPLVKVLTSDVQLVQVPISSRTGSLLRANVSINGYLLDALIDSGSAISLVDSRYVCKEHVVDNKKLTITTANNTKMPSLGSAIALVGFGSFTMHHPVALIDNFLYPALIGLDCLQRFEKMHVDFAAS
ncbi:MAG TPA: hypothetical protein VKH37_00965, partial [Ferruginibacter sp.]|nr:hypothetical protein [Ferruginibacter sp.]